MLLLRGCIIFSIIIPYCQISRHSPDLVFYDYGLFSKLKTFTLKKTNQVINKLKYEFSNAFFDGVMSA